MKLATVYALLWIGWLAAFATIEFSALFGGHPQYSLSDLVWRLEGTGRAWSALRYFVAAFCIWFAGHMTFRWWG